MVLSLSHCVAMCSVAKVSEVRSSVSGSKLSLFILKQHTTETEVYINTVFKAKRYLATPVRVSRGCIEIHDASSRCYGVTGEVRTRWRQATIEEMLQTALSVGPLRPTKFGSDSECSAVEGVVVTC
jgi:hypothetical protein